MINNKDLRNDTSLLITVTGTNSLWFQKEFLRSSDKHWFLLICCPLEQMSFPYLLNSKERRKTVKTIPNILRATLYLQWLMSMPLPTEPSFLVVRDVRFLEFL